MDEVVKLVIFVPVTHADIVRKAMGDAGAGKLGNYTHCTFSSKGIGRYMPAEGAHPFIGEVGKMEQVEEEKIEILCPKRELEKVITAMKKVHPYDEVAYEIHPLLQNPL